MVVIFLILLLAPVVFSYVVYPVLMRLLATWRPRPWKFDDSSTPTISVILAVRNEEELIVGCIRSILEQDYPTEKIEILIGSDASTDRTNELLLAESAANSAIRPVLFEVRRGKMPVVNDLVRKATGEVLIFADADIQFAQRAFRAHARHYVDPTIGCVAGYLRFQGQTEDAVLASEAAYMALENDLRMHEAKFSSTIGLFGGNYSLRRKDFREIPPGAVHDDLFAALQIIEKGKRTVFDTQAISVEPFVRTMADEFKRKARNAGRGYRTLAHFPDLVSPRAGFVSVMIWAHRLLRWLSPFFLFAVVLLCGISHVTGTSLPLLDYSILFIAFCMVAGFVLDKMGLSVPLIGNVYWLIIMNSAFAVGTLRVLFGKEPVLWTQTSRADIPLTEKEVVL